MDSNLLKLMMSLLSHILQIVRNGKGFEQNQKYAQRIENMLNDEQ